MPGTFGYCALRFCVGRFRIPGPVTYGQYPTMANYRTRSRTTNRRISFAVVETATHRIDRANIGIDARRTRFDKEISSFGRTSAYSRTRHCRFAITFRKKLIKLQFRRPRAVSRRRVVFSIATFRCRFAADSVDYRPPPPSKRIRKTLPTDPNADNRKTLCHVLSAHAISTDARTAFKPLSRVRPLLPPVYGIRLKNENVFQRVLHRQTPKSNVNDKTIVAHKTVVVILQPETVVAVLFRVPRRNRLMSTTVTTQSRDGRA